MTVDVVNAHEQEGRLARRERRGVRRAREGRPDPRVGHSRQRRRRRGTHATKNRALGQRQRQEAVAAEGHRPRARRRDPQPAVAQGRHGVRAAAAQLRLLVPKKVEKGALRAALAHKLQGGDVVVVDALAATRSRPRRRSALLKRLGVDGKALIVDVHPDEKFALSVRNIAGVPDAAEQPHHRARRRWTRARSC